MADQQSSILRLLIGGKIYMINKSAAIRHPESLLACLATKNLKSISKSDDRRKSMYVWKETGDYFIDRSPLYFDFVIRYMNSGRFERPSHVCRRAVEEEFEFWGLKLIEEEKDDEEDNETVDLKLEDIEELDGHNGCLGRIWRLFEYPKSSRLAMVINALCVFFILTSIINFVASTVPSFRSSCVDEDPTAISNRRNQSTDVVSPSSDHDPSSQPPSPHSSADPSSCHRATNDWYFDIVESVCTIWFTLEFALRFVSCPRKLKFVRSPLNIIDFLATIPFCVEMLAYAAVGGHRYINSRDSGVVSALLILMRVLRIVRVVRSFRLARYINSFQLLCALAWNSRGDFGLLLLFLSVGTLTFSTLMYYAEKDEKDTAYTSISATFWWCVVTFSTVGYGDVTPTTMVGKILAGIACISGILIITFPVSIITDTFRSTYDAHKKQRRKESGPPTTMTKVDDRRPSRLVDINNSYKSLRDNASFMSQTKF